jgi:hypothetical protein
VSWRGYAATLATATCQRHTEHHLERLQKDWNAPIYAFFDPIPNIDYEKGRRFHEFVCGAKGCKRKVRRYLDKKDARSTSNLRKHAKSCWGAGAVEAADRTQDVLEARDSVVKPLSKDGTITAVFERVGKGKVSYSHRQHTKTETKYVPLLTHTIDPDLKLNRAEIVRWVAENVRPFEIVKDRAFQNLMKTGRPGYYIPSPSTVSRDVRTVFSRTRQRIAKMLRVRRKTFPQI